MPTGYNQQKNNTTSTLSDNCEGGAKVAQSKGCVGQETR